MITNKLKLDDIDRKIISMIQDDPNLTHSQIAKHINRSQPTVGMRIKKLEKSGILQFQPGINFKKVALNLASVELETKNPEEIMEMARYCPFILNAMKLSGKNNVWVLLASSELEKLDKIVNFHFKQNPNILNVSKIELIFDFAKDFIFPIDFSTDDHHPDLENGCGIKCRYRITKK